MPDRSALQDLVGILETFHFELTREVENDPMCAERTAESHLLTRRLIIQQVPRTSEDISLYLKAADLARKLDPGFLDDEPGSTVDLLRRAVCAIEQLHLRNRIMANKMLSDLQRTKE